MSNKLKWSNFHITVNLNASNRDRITTIQDIVSATNALASSDWLWRWIKEYKNGARRDFTGADKMLVETVRIRAGIEQEGENNRSVHAHLVVEIGHRTAVQVDYAGIKNCFREFTHREPNVRVDFIRGSGENLAYILKYITKEVPRNANKRWQRKLRDMETVTSVNNTTPI